MIVRELITRLGFKLDPASQRNAEAGINKVKSAAEKLGETVRNALFAFGGFQLGKSLLDIGDLMQSFRARLELLPQTVTSSAEAFDVVAAHASAAGMSIDAYTNMYLKLGNAAKDLLPTQDSILSITDTISKALVVGGATAQEQASALLQFGQALGSGVLQGEEFRAMAEAAPQFLDELSKALAIPREELKKMASEGKLTSKAVIEATQKMASVFDDKFKQMPMTVGRAMTTVGNRFKLAIDKMNRSTMFVTTIANAILAGFDKIEDGITWLIEKFGGLENMLRAIGIVIGVVIGGQAVKAFLALRGVAAVTLLPLLKMVALVAAAALVIEDLYVWVKGGESLIGRWIGPWEDWSSRVFAAWEVLKSFVVWIGEAVGAIAAMLVGAFTLDWNLFAAGAAGFFDMIFDKIAQVGSTIWSVVSGAFDRLTDYIGSVFLNWAMQLSGALIEGFNRVKAVFGAGVGVAGAPSTTSAVGTGSTPIAGVTPTSMAPSNMGAARPSVSSTTNVNVTVPPGTTAEQTKHLQNAAQKSFEKQSNAALARDLATRAP